MLVFTVGVAIVVSPLPRVWSPGEATMATGTDAFTATFPALATAIDALTLAPGANPLTGLAVPLRSVKGAEMLIGVAVTALLSDFFSSGSASPLSTRAMR